jgi:tRNA-Thr(GGU) m(6)t(6)A37 methyltransferase TsaA
MREGSDKKYVLRPIGVIYSMYKTRKEAPPHAGDAVSRIEVFEEYARGLADIEKFSHIILLYWLHKSPGYHLSVMTPWDTKPHGLFATRTPDRPNPIGLQVVELLKIHGRILHVRSVDAIDGTPLIDIKHYSVSIDYRPDANEGWFSTRKNQ